MKKMVERKMRAKQDIIIKIATHLQQRPEVIFAYIFGSFAESKERFNDIDIGVFVKTTVLKDALLLEFSLDNGLEKIIGLPVDVRIINHAPVYFSYQVIRPRMIIMDKEPNIRADFESKVFKAYFDLVRFRGEYLKEVVNAPI